MNTGEKYEVQIEKLSSSSSGIARIGGFVVFVPDTCPQDKVKIKIVKVNKNFANGEIVEITEPSKYRVTPFCPMQKVCGACQIQFIDYDYQLEIKREIVKDTLQKIGNIDIEIPKVIPSPDIKNYRHKIQYPVSQTKNSKRILAGYYKPYSHEIVNIKYCPIQPEICDKIIDFIRVKAQELNISGYNENNHTGILRHVVIRHSAENQNCLVTFVLNGDLTANITTLAQKLYDRFEHVVGVCVNINTKRTNVILGNKTQCVCGLNYIEESMCGNTFRIGAETFFQVNPKSAQNIFNYIRDFIKANYNKPVILDAYAGISAIGICLSDVAEKVVSIEENLKSVELAKDTAKLNKIPNIEINGGDAGEFFKSQKQKFDVVILDPPRKGCTPESLAYAMELCKGHIIYVSCNPATLARDLKILKEKGGTIESVQPFDMFCHTYHIENVAITKV